MKLIPALLLGLGLIPFARATDVAPADANWTKYADNKIFAQTVVNGLLQKHPELDVLAIHALHADGPGGSIIAANLDRIGKKDDDDDLLVSQNHCIVLAPNLTDPAKYEVLIPLQDGTGHFIGTIGCVFKHHAGDSEIGLLQRAIGIRDEVAKQVPSLAALYQIAN
jgi:hypothetical protein